MAEKGNTNGGFTNGNVMNNRVTREQDHAGRAQNGRVEDPEAARGTPRQTEVADTSGSSHGANTTCLSLSDSGTSPRYHRHEGAGIMRVPTRIYDRYPNEMDGQTDHTQGQGHQNHRHGNRDQYPPDVPIDIDQVNTLYVRKSDNVKTLMRRRREASKKRSSSRRKVEMENLNDLMLQDDNHLLPSLRYTRKQRTKSLKERRSDLEDEKREQDALEESFKQQFTSLKNSHEMTAGNFAELLRTSTLRKMKSVTDWQRPDKMERLHTWRREHFSRFNLWVTTFKSIEGKFGTVVMSFFKFIRWLFFLNLFLMIVMLGMTTIPYLAHGSQEFQTEVKPNMSKYMSQAIVCTNNYTEYAKDLFNNETMVDKIKDFLQGTGWMERTVLFYGIYHNATRTNSEGETFNYNMGLFYILSIGLCFTVTVVLLIRNSAKTVKKTFGIEKSTAAYTNKVYSGWDFAISNKKAAKLKHRNIYIEYKACIDEEIERLRRAKWSYNDRATLYLKRIMVNCFVVGMLAGSLVAVYFTTRELIKLEEQDLNEFTELVVQYLPYLTITVLNFSLPIVFQKIVILEDYSPMFALRITLFRSIFLRLAPLVVVTISLYRLLITDHDYGQCGNQLWDKTSKTAKGNIKCWETYVGQQIYKMVLLDFAVEFGIVIFVHFPRRLLYDKFSETFIMKKVGPQEFDLSQNVIDIIYTQALCWLGMFFSPLIPLMTFLKSFLFFYIRKFALLHTCAQSGKIYRSSGSVSLFMFVLLTSFLLVIALVGYMVGSISPSQSCGPFRVYSSENYTMFSVVTNTVRSGPRTISDILTFMTSVAFLVPACLVVVLLMYYFWLLKVGYKKREEILSDQVKMVSKDKKFLLARVNEVLM